MKNAILIAFLILLSTITSCKKKELSVRYPEDTEDTYLTPPERLCNKWWILDSVSLNGMDYTDTLDLYIGEYKFYIESKELKSQSFNAYYRNGKILTEKNLSQLNIKFYFSTSYEAIAFYSESTPFQSDTVISFAPYFYHPYTSNWEVRKLSNEQLKIKIQHKDTTIINYFKSI